MAGGNDIEVTGSGMTEEQNRGRDTTAGAGKEKKRRDRSKAPAETPTAEQIVDEIAGRFERVEFNFKTLESHVLDEIESVKGNVQEGLDACTVTEDRLDRLEALVRDLQGSIEGMREDIAMCKRAIASGGASTSTSSPKVECPKPNGYNGVRDAKEIDNFLWRMQQYFEGIGLTDETAKVRTATLYLSDTAMLWWRRKHGDIERGLCRIDTWDDFVKELKRQFYPENVVYEARKKLRELKQKGTIRDYVKEFTTLMLQIPNMTEEDSLFFFVDGLQHWAKQELQRRGVKTVDDAIAAAESLIEFRPQPSSEAAKKKERYPARGGGEKRDQKSRDPRDQRRAPVKEGDRGAGRQSYEERKQAFVPKGGCFVCKGPHAMKDCPKLGSLSAIINRQEAEDKEEEPNVIGSLQVLNALKAKPMRATSSKGLMYVEAHINGKPTKALVDTGASHNFITKEEATRLGLSWSEGDGWVKTVNANARRLEGVVSNANLQLGTWKGHVNFSVAPMDDFKVVLGMDFLRQVTAIPMPSFNAVCILEKGSPCMVPTVEADGAANTKQLSATQVAKGAKSGQLTYLAVLKKDDGRDKSPDMPPIIRNDLEEKRDMVPTELPNKLPPRREVDHKVELEQGAQPHAKETSQVSPPKLEGFATTNQAKGDILARIEEGLQRDPMARELIKLAMEGKTKRFWVEDGLLYTKRRRLYIPKWDNLRRDLIKECHDTKWAGHPGQKRTLALLEAAYFWPQMRDSVEAYVRTCLVCQQDKIENKHPAGLLEPLPVPKGPWDSITLDFISALPKSEGYGSIMVVVDRFSKYGTFIPCTRDCTAEEAARAFFKNVVKYWGLPRSIISDRDPRFTGRLWTELFKLLGTELNFSTSFHPQTDGQTERVNALLECYLRHFVSANQRDWAKLIDIAQFSYNLQRSEATGRSPFELATGRQPLTPHTVVTPLRDGKSPGAEKMAKSWEEQADMARACLEKARRKMKKWADGTRRPQEFSVGDQVLVKLFKTFRSLHKGLVRKYEGPFPIIGKVGRVSYRVDLPPTMKIHPVFHVSMLKPYQGDVEDSSRGYSRRAPPLTTKSYDKEAEEVLASDIIRRRGVPPKRRYLIKWKGLPESEASWELEEDLWQFRDIIEAHEATRASPV